MVATTEVAASTAPAVVITTALATETDCPCRAPAPEMTPAAVIVASSVTRFCPLTAPAPETVVGATRAPACVATSVPLIVNLADASDRAPDTVPRGASTLVPATTLLVPEICPLAENV